MPMIEFKCEKCEHSFDEIITQSELSEKEFPKCPKCGCKKVIRKFGNVAVHFKGSGWTK